MLSIGQKISRSETYMFDTELKRVGKRSFIYLSTPSWLNKSTLSVTDNPIRSRIILNVFQMFYRGTKLTVARFVLQFFLHWSINYIHLRIS